MRNPKLNMSEIRQNIYREFAQRPPEYKIVVLPEESLKSNDSLFSNLPEVMTCKETAKALNICEKTLRELARRGVIQGFKVGKVWRFTRKALADFVRGGTDEKV